MLWSWIQRGVQQLQNVPAPVPGPFEIVVRLDAVSLDQIDLLEFQNLLANFT
jgi:NADPH:quinone reductase-like Zn-dependent oxidoreductase